MTSGRCRNNNKNKPVPNTFHIIQKKQKKPKKQQTRMGKKKRKNSFRTLSTHKAEFSMFLETFLPSITRLISITRWSDQHSITGSVHFTILQFNRSSNSRCSKILKIQEIQNKWDELWGVPLSYTWVPILHFLFVFFSQRKAVIVIRVTTTPQQPSFQQCWFPQVFSSLSPSLLKERGIFILSLTEKQRTPEEEDYDINS